MKLRKEWWDVDRIKCIDGRCRACVWPSETVEGGNDDDDDDDDWEDTI